VRELKNVIERAAILSSDVITIADLPEDPHESPFDDDGAEADDDRDDTIDDGATADAAMVMHAADGTRLTLREFRERSERSYIVDTLRAFEWNISRTAIALGVERTNLHKKIRAYGVKRGE
jgi:DNA-binding NtrC family response regulator